MKQLLTLTLLVLTLSGIAQKKEEPIEYYTDSKVRHHVASLQTGYMYYYSGRRLISESADPTQAYYFLASEVNGKYGQGFGGDLLIKLRPSLELGVGLYKTDHHYQWDFESIVQNTGGNTDTLKVKRWDIYSEYLSVPIQFGFVTQVVDRLWLQVYPALELNWLQDLRYDYELANEPAVIEDKTAEARDFNLAINFAVGAEYRFAERFGVFTRIQFRYFFYPAVPAEPVTEVIYSAGGHTGLRFYF